MAQDLTALEQTNPTPDDVLEAEERCEEVIQNPAGSSRPRIGVVLGAGAARGWAHVGVLRELERMGLPIDIVCGCSSGALVAASYAAGRLNVLETLAERMTKVRMLRFFDVSWARGGLIEGRMIINFLQKNVGDAMIEDLPIRYGAVATEFGTGREVWLKHGSLIDAARASIALPGLLTPIELNGRLLFDGALVNPLPVALCRALGADVIIAVKLDRHLPAPAETLDVPEPSKGWWSWASRGTEQPSIPNPSYTEVISDSIFTMTSLIQRVRLATNPVDVLIEPNLSDLGVMEFHRARDFVERGVEATRRADWQLEPFLELPSEEGAQVSA